MTDWWRVRAEAAATRVTTAQARATHAHACPSLPAADSRRKQTRNRPSTRRDRGADRRDSCARRAQGGEQDEQQNSQREGGHHRPVVQTVRHCIRGRKITPLRAGHPPCVDEKWNSGNGCEREHRRLQRARARTRSAWPDATRPGERTRRRLRPRGPGTTTPRRQHRPTQAQSRQARSAEFRRYVAPADEAGRANPTGGSHRTSHPTPRQEPGFGPDRRSR